MGRCCDGSLGAVDNLVAHKTQQSLEPANIFTKPRVEGVCVCVCVYVRVFRAYGLGWLRLGFRARIRVKVSV